MVSNVGVPQGTVLSLLLLTLYKSDFIYNSECCHGQKVTDTTAAVGCIRSGQDEEYRKLIADFVEWCESRQFHLNSSKTKELMVDFRVSGWGLGRKHKEVFHIWKKCRGRQALLLVWSWID